MVGGIRRTVDVVTAFGCVVFALELLYSTRPSLRVEDFWALVLLEGVPGEVG
jgi:hypothetical protein